MSKRRQSHLRMSPRNEFEVEDAYALKSVVDLLQEM